MQSGTITLEAIARRILRGTRVLAVCGLAGGALAAAYLSASPATYQAEARILIDPRPLVLAGRDPRAAPVADRGVALARLDGEVRTLKSVPVLLAVVDDLSLDEDPEFTAPSAGWTRLLDALGITDGAGIAPPANCVARTGATPGCEGGARRAALRRLQDRVSVRRAGGTFVVAVQARSTVPAKAMRIADAVVAAYRAEVARAGAERLEQAGRSIEAGRDALADHLKTADDRVVAATRRLGAVDGSEGDVDGQQLAVATRSLVEARVRLETLKARDEQLARLARSGGDLDDVAFPDLPALEALRLQAAALARREGAARTRLGARHPDTVALAGQRARNSTLLQTELARTARAVHHDHERARVAADLLAARVDDLTRRKLAASTGRVEVRALERVAAAEGDALQASARRALELDQAGALDVANLRLLGPASTPRGPATPRLALVCVAAAAGLTLGAAFLAIRTETSDGADDIPDHFPDHLPDHAPNAGDPSA